MPSNSSHWAARYIGKPYKAGAHGPDFFDCAGIVEWVYEHHYNSKIPIIPYTNSKLEVKEETTKYLRNSDYWKKINKPIDGAVAALSTETRIQHVGIYLDINRGMILHAHSQMGVVIQKPENMRNSIWNRIEYYIPKSWDKSV